MFNNKKIRELEEQIDRLKADLNREEIKILNAKTEAYNSGFRYGVMNTLNDLANILAVVQDTNLDTAKFLETINSRIADTGKHFQHGHWGGDNAQPAIIDSDIKDEE